MRRERRLRCVLLALIMLVFSFFPALKTEAGIKVTVLDESSLESSKWSNPEEDVLVENGAIVFSEQSTGYSRFISKMAVKRDERFSVLMSLSASLEFSKLPQGKSFIMAFGLSGIEACQGDAGNVEVAFADNGNLQVGITVFDEQNDAIVVAEPKNCGISRNSRAKVKVEIHSDGMLRVYVNGKMVCSGKLPVTGEGRIGFMQTGECGVRISDLDVRFYQYERPENTNISEDFEKGTLDTSKLTAKTIGFSSCYPSGQVIEEYNGSQVLKFQNLYVAYVGTVYPYSNFEMSFDIPYIRTAYEINEDGSLREESQSDFVVSIGAEAANFDSVHGWQSAAESLIFDSSGVRSYNYPKEYKGELARNPFVESRPVTVKVSVIDSLVTVGIKWTEEKTFQTILTYTLKGEMPTGYVQIWSRDRANFAIDNLRIENLDEEPNVIETEFTSGEMIKPEDATYEAMERIYQEVELDEEKTTWNCWYLLIPATLVVGGVTLAVFASVCKKAKKEVTANEE